MNNKGQVLVIFIIIIPILLLLVTLVVDLGLLYKEKQSISNNIKNALEYYLDSKDSNALENMKELLNQNIKESKIDIKDEEEYIEITVSKKWNSLSIKKDEEIIITYKCIKNSKEIIKG